MEEETSWRNRLSSTPIENPLENLRSNPNDDGVLVNSLEVNDSHLEVVEEVEVKSGGQRFVSRTQIEEIRQWSRRVSDVVRA